MQQMQGRLVKDRVIHEKVQGAAAELLTCMRGVPSVKDQGFYKGRRGEAELDPQERRLLNRVKMSALQLGIRQ